MRILRASDALNILLVSTVTALNHSTPLSLWISNYTNPFSLFIFFPFLEQIQRVTIDDHRPINTNPINPQQKKKINLNQVN